MFRFEGSTLSFDAAGALYRIYLNVASMSSASVESDVDPSLWLWVEDQTNTSSEIAGEQF